MYEDSTAFVMAVRVLTASASCSRALTASTSCFLVGILLALGVLITPVDAAAEAERKVDRIGVLDVVPEASNAANVRAFRQGLKELGYVEGQNLMIEYRSADGRADRFPALAREMVRRKIDVIMTRGTPAALAAKHATATIPIVMASSGDPVGTGLVASLAHPGGNIMGLSALATDIQSKQLEVLREVVPRLARVAFLFNMSNPVLQAQWRRWRARWGSRRSFSTCESLTISSLRSTARHTNERMP